MDSFGVGLSAVSQRSETHLGSGQIQHPERFAHRLTLIKLGAMPNQPNAQWLKTIMLRSLTVKCLAICFRNPREYCRVFDLDFLITDIHPAEVRCPIRPRLLSELLMNAEGVHGTKITY